jgi:hypothetical protein
MKPCSLLESRLLRAMVSMLQSQTTMFAMLQAEGIAIACAFLLFFLVCVVALLQSRLLRAIGSMLQSQTTMVATLQAEGIAITAAFLLLFLVCVVALLQSRLIKAAGHWQQYRASVIQPRNHTLLSRTNTTAAELYYLRHMRSCAAAAMGNKGGNPSPSTALQISGASFIGRLLQTIWRRCYLIVFLPFDRLLQSIGQMVRYYAKTAMKLITVSFAMLQDILTWLTPLESAACFHLANAYMHQDFYTCYSPNKASAAEGFLLAFYRIAFVHQDFARGSGYLGQGS